MALSSAQAGLLLVLRCNSSDNACEGPNEVSVAEAEAVNSVLGANGLQKGVCTYFS